MSILLSTLEYPSIDPVLLRLGPLAVRWYGLAYLTGFALAYAVLRRMQRRKQLALSAAQLSDMLSWLIAGVLVGGRMGWWVFYHRSQGMPEPWYEPFAIWHGGMSFHGGLIGVVAALLLWTWRNRVSIWHVADRLALVTPIGLFLGRIANFINAELVGRPTSLPWGVIFPGEAFARHPSQIYEALLEGPLLLVILWLVWRRVFPRPGRIASLFLVLYGTFRFAVEFTREPDPQLGFILWGWLTMGQLLSAALIAAGAVLWRCIGGGPARSRRFCQGGSSRDSDTIHMLEESDGARSYPIE